MIKKRNGQATVEFALLLPCIIFLLLVIVEVGMMLNSYIRLVNASRIAARVIAVGGTGATRDADAETAIENILGGMYQGDIKINDSSSSSDTDVMVTPDADERTRGKEVSVQIEYDYTPFTGIGLVLPEKLTVKTVMMME